MVTWRELTAEQADRDWDAWLGRFKDAHIRQTRAWARLKSRSWTPVHLAVLNGEAPVALALCLVRPVAKGLATVCWVNGGPVFEQDRPEGQNAAAFGKMLEAIKERFSKTRGAIVRLNLAHPNTVQEQLLLRQAGFVKPLHPLDTGLTYVVDLSRDLADLRAGLERNWRNQLRQAEEAKPEFSVGQDPKLLERYLVLHNALCERKGLRGQRLSLEDLRSMTRELGERIVFFVGAAEGRDGCGGALWRLGDKAWFGLSAANDWGLERNLPNAFYWRAIEHLKAAGARSFDLTGIDPKANWGVYNFKRGLKAPLVESVGEWEWSGSPWLRRAFNLGLWLRRDSLA
jgi:hypothetical protein